MPYATYSLSPRPVIKSSVMTCYLFTTRYMENATCIRSFVDVTMVLRNTFTCVVPVLCHASYMICNDVSIC